ncbi:MAG: GNAT family N-acetyltransferase [Acetobacter sp.]|uniref:GNAT family N-acetyltransferase n=1 Tax=Acetobacter sp. TaxID=440 RepID=UPI0039EB564D
MEPVDRVLVDVTFLEMIHPPRFPVIALPSGFRIEQEHKPTVALYRQLHTDVGGKHCWWMRRVKSDGELATILAEPRRSLFLLKENGVVRGFFEFELHPHRTVNLAYFGLVPDMIGRGIGRAFLSQAVDMAWSANPLRVTVNTCTADHRRALPAYLAIGFRVLGVVREEWDIPLRLDLPVPEHLTRL